LRRRAGLGRCALASPLGATASGRLKSTFATRRAMAIFETFSKRQKGLQSGGRIDPYVYDEIPSALRKQIDIIINDMMGNINESIKKSLGKILYKEHIEDSIFNIYSPFDENFDNIILYGKNDLFLDAVEIIFKKLLKLHQSGKISNHAIYNITQSVPDAIDELNYRFREHGVGYQFVGHELVRVDNQVLHTEAVVPALTLLTRPGYEGAENEFQSAYKHYRAGEHRAAVVAANNAFESTLKAICKKRGWEHDNGATAGRLLKIVKDNGLYPDYLDKSFDQLLAALASGLPTVRNEEGGHGQGAEVRETPAHVVALALHLAAAKILFLVECERALP
jgi:HEPN domain-containing protein